MPRNLIHALGGIGIAVAIVLAVFFVISPEVRMVGAVMIGGTIIMLAWLVESLLGMYHSPHWVVNVVATIGFGLWVALVTALVLRPDFLEMVVPVVVWLGGIAVITAIMVPSIKAIRSQDY